MSGASVSGKELLFCDRPPLVKNSGSATGQFLAAYM